MKPKVKLLVVFMLLVGLLVFVGSVVVYLYYFQLPNVRTYTRAFCSNGVCQDYYIVCNGNNLINETAIGYPIPMENVSNSTAPLCPPD
jgi:hypothetical protein